MHHHKHMIVNLANKPINDAINFIAAEIWESIKFSDSCFFRWNSTITDKVKKLSCEEAIPIIKTIPWINFSPSETKNDVEVLQLQKEFSSAKNTDLEFYFAYHYCESFAVLQWTLLKTQGQNPKIGINSNHVFVVNDGQIIDPISKWANLEITSEIKYEFDNPRDFWRKAYLSENLQDWEQVKFDKLDMIVKNSTIDNKKL